jgi:S-adenosylmethionine decarboxylase
MGLGRWKKMLFAAEPVADLQREWNYIVHYRSSGVYNPSFQTSTNAVALTATPGALPCRHLIVELHDAVGLDDALIIDDILRQAAEDAQAQILALHHHVFTPSNGVTAFAMLAESHISIHTWPVERYAAVDIFMCGVCDPLACLPALATAFQPERMSVLNLSRGLHTIKPAIVSAALIPQIEELNAGPRFDSPTYGS